MFLLLVCSVSGQQVTGKAKTTGTCSPANTGNNNTFNITCQGIPDKLGAQLIDLLNRFAKNQSDAEAMMAKLDGCLTGVREVRERQAGRRLSDQQKALLLSALRPFKGAKVTVSAADGDPEAYGYASDFVAVFRAAEFELVVFAAGAETTGINGLRTLGGAPDTGVVLQPKDETAWKTPLFQSLDRALSKGRIQHSAQYIGKLQIKPTDLEMYVGLKPNN